MDTNLHFVRYLNLAVRPHYCIKCTKTAKKRKNRANDYTKKVSMVISIAFSRFQKGQHKQMSEEQ